MHRQLSVCIPQVDVCAECVTWMNCGRWQIRREETQITPHIPLRLLLSTRLESQHSFISFVQLHTDMREMHSWHTCSVLIRRVVLCVCEVCSVASGLNFQFWVVLADSTTEWVNFRPRAGTHMQLGLTHSPPSCRI